MPLEGQRSHRCDVHGSSGYGVFVVGQGFTARGDSLASQTTITFGILYPSKEAREAALKMGMKEGMSQSFDRLAEYVRTIA